MKAHHYLKLENTIKDLNESEFSQSARITLVTNFTDQILQKLLAGLSIEQGIYPHFYTAPYKHYHLLLTDTSSELYTNLADITYFVFDYAPFGHSEFANKTHIDDVLEGLQQYVSHTDGHVVINTFEIPPMSAYGNLSTNDPIQVHIETINKKLREFANKHNNVSVLEIGRLFNEFGDTTVRDMRSMYAFDIPFTNQFSLALGTELMTYLVALRGKAKKCIVLDLDDTLWGGVIGEDGLNSIELGPGYPGMAYQDFQRLLLSYQERGILLAICSKNNEQDVEEMFAKNSHMILNKNHFSAMRINWGQKSKNITEIANELNIGLDSIVFVDNDPVNREEVRMALPEVYVLELPNQPEEYAHTLLSYRYFDQLTLTEEDTKKSQMYQEEKARREIIVQGNRSTYLKKLNIQITISKNRYEHLARAAQMCQKTNQFNITTKRYSEADLTRLMNNGAKVYTAEVQDNFGHYGIVALAILIPTSKNTIELDTFLMSCRVMGRDVEKSFLDYILQLAAAAGYSEMIGTYEATQKNTPVREFLPQMGFLIISGTIKKQKYTLDINSYCLNKPKELTGTLSSITISKD